MFGKKKNEKVVLIFSGGVDSTTLLYKLNNDGYDVHALTFNYGQKHLKEIEYASKTTKLLNIPHKIIDISSIKHLLNSALTSNYISIPEGFYTDEVMKQTVVPMRNAIMLSIAVGYATSINSNIIAFAAHTGDHPIYPDCRPAFLKTFNIMANVATDNYKLKIIAPFLKLKKDDIVRLGKKLNVDYSLTWSCYKGGEKHCGICGTCVERKESFELTSTEDIEYEN